MSGSTQHGVTDAFAQRCLALRLVAWRYDDQGQVLLNPQAPDAAMPLLRPTCLHQWVQSAATSWASQRQAQPEALFPGCWLIPIRPPKAARRSTPVLAMAFSSEVKNSESFQKLSTAAGLSRAQAHRCLESLVLAERFSDPLELQRILQWSYEDLTRRSRDQITIDEFSEKLIHSYEVSNFHYRLARLLNWSSDPLNSIQVTCQQMHAIMPFTWIAVRFGADNTVPVLADQLVLAGTLSCALEPFNQSVAALLADYRADDWTGLLMPGQNELADLVQSAVITERITHDQKVIGVILAGNKKASDTEISSDETQFLDACADFLGVFHENLSRYEEQRTMFLGTLQALTASIDAKDRYTCGHSERVSLLGDQLAAALGLDSKRVEQVRISGQVHDVGKIGIPESVLCKPGRLTEEEFEQIKRHPVIGYQILRDIPPLADMLTGVLFHHERWDGRGYPQGLRGEQIPLYGRILGCADTFDAMSSTRSYRPALPREKVLAEIRKCARSQFDPQIAECFVALDFADYDRMVHRHRAASSEAA